jgi:hypothetical protein
MSLLIFIYAVSSGKDVFVSMPLMPPVIFFYIDILAYISEFPLILPVSENTNISNTLLFLKIGCCWYTTVASYKKIYRGRRISVYHRFYLWWEEHVVTNIICFQKYPEIPIEYRSKFVKWIGKFIQNLRNKIKFEKIM